MELGKLIASIVAVWYLLFRRDETDLLDVAFTVFIILWIMV